jgi:transposase-like protein
MSKLSSIEELFAGRHFDRELLILCVRWYLRYELSFRDLVEVYASDGTGTFSKLLPQSPSPV